MEISVVVLTYPRKPEHLEMLDECMEAIFQHSKGAEIVLIDNHAPLDTSRYKDKVDQYVRMESNMGCAGGWNKGLEIAKGKYIAVVSDDVVVKEGYLEAMIEALETIPNALVSAPAVEKLPNGMGFFGIQESRNWFPGSCFMVTQETLKKVGYFDTQFVPFNYEDVDYWTRVYKAGGVLARNYSVEVEHKEGQVIHSIEDNGEVDSENRKKYLKKWGFDPTPIFYGHTYANFPWEG